MEPYRTDRPKVYADMPNSLTALLGRLADAGIPLTHTLYEYAMNPDAPVSETAQNLTDEFVPFKYQIRSGEATPSSLTKEAALMFSPSSIKGYRNVTYKPVPQRKYYAPENPLNHNLYVDNPKYPNTVETVPDVGNGFISSSGLKAENFHEVDPVKFIQDKQQLAQMSIDAANKVPTRYEGIGDIQLASKKRHYSYGELIEKQRTLEEQIDKFNWKRGWKRNFKTDPLTPDEQNKLYKLQNQLNEVDIELGLSDYKAAIDNTYGPYYDDLYPQHPISPRDYDQSWSYNLTNTRKDISKIK